MALNSDIRDQAYQFFIEEAPELLQSLETELLTLSQEQSTAKIHSLMRTAHSIKGGAASVGLEAIATIAHRLENIFKALYGETTVIDTDLESQLLQAYDCLRLPLTEQITTGYFDVEQANELAEPIFAQIETDLSDALIESENYIPTSSDLGVDMVSSILEVDVAQGLEHLERVVDSPGQYEVAGELRAQTEVFAGFAELLNLPAFGAIAETVQRALDTAPYRALDITKLAVRDFEQMRQWILAEKHLGSHSGSSRPEKLPSEALIAIANNSDSSGHLDVEFYSEIEETPDPLPAEAFYTLTDTAIPEIDHELAFEASTDSAAGEIERELEFEASVDASLSLLEDVFGGEIDSGSTEPDEFEPSAVDPAEAASSVAKAERSEVEAESSEIEFDEITLALDDLLDNAADSSLLEGNESELWAVDPVEAEQGTNAEFPEDEAESFEIGLDEISSVLDDWLDGEIDSSSLESDEVDSKTIQTVESELDEMASEALHLNDSNLQELVSSPIEATDEVENIQTRYVLNNDEDDIIDLLDEDLSVDESEQEKDPASNESISSSIIHIKTYQSLLDDASSDADTLEASGSIEEVVHSIEDAFDALPSLDEGSDSNLDSGIASFLQTTPKTSTAARDVASFKQSKKAPSPGSSGQSASPQYRQSARRSQRAKTAATPHLTIRVEAERLERMSNLVGELAINRDGISVQNNQLQSSLRELLGRFSRFQERIDQLRNLSDQMLVAPERSRRAKMAAVSEVSDHSENGDSRFAAGAGIAGYTPTSPSSADISAFSTDFDSLEMDSYDALHLQLQEIFEDVVQLEEKVDDVSLFAKQADQRLGQQRQMLVQLRDDLTWARMVPLSEVLNRFPRILRDLSINYHKPVDLTLTGTGVLVDKAMLEKLYDPLLHLLRNAFDHGIESSDVRRRMGKPPEGHIEVRAYHRGNQTIIQVEDDGQGLNLDRICDRAVERGWLTTDQVASIPANQLYELIFEPGFSTAHQVSELSGRGVGLDVVRAQLHGVRGTVTVNSTPGQGTVFTLHLPLTLTITKLITFSSGPVVLTISADRVEEISTPQSDQIRQLGRQRFLQWKENIIPIHRIADLLDYNCPLPEMLPNKLSSDLAAPSNWGAPMLILRRERQTFAVEVDRIITEQELVVKPFGSAIAPPPYAYGCTILGDGSLVPVIDGTALLMFGLEGSSITPSETVRVASRATIPALPEGPKAPAIRSAQAPTLLVVDDSATLRRTLALSLERAGFRVLQARDGQEAIERLQQSSSVKLIICDIEMPNMNGFEFLNHRRQDVQIADIPVVMLTSRSNEKHRWLATQLGASAYFTKPYLEQEFIETLADILH